MRGRTEGRVIIRDRHVTLTDSVGGGTTGANVKTSRGESMRFIKVDEGLLWDSLRILEILVFCSKIHGVSRVKVGPIRVLVSVRGPPSPRLVGV